MAKADQASNSILSRLDASAAVASFLNNGLVGIIMVSLDGLILHVNDTFCRMTGFAEVEIIGRKESDLVHPEDAKASLANLNVERRYVRKNGEVLFTKVSASLERDKETGEALLILMLITDVTALAEKKRLDMTLQSIGDAVICTDAAGLVTFMNPVAEKLTGWSIAEATAQPVIDIFNLIEESSGKRSLSPVARCMQDGKAYTIETGTILISRSGDAYDIGFSAAPIKAPGEDALGAIVIFNDVTKDRADQKRVARSAYHDGLTGLPNRATFMIKVQSALNEAKEQDRMHALCFIDLDRFKLVNDQGGHAAGDALLSHVAKLIALSCTSKDVPARIGGDEFAILIRDCSSEEAEAAANAIVRAIDSIEFRWETQLFRIGASIGATMVTRNSASLAEVLDEADRACYGAKNAGRGQVRIRKPESGATTGEGGLFRAKSTNMH